MSRKLEIVFDGPFEHSTGKLVILSKPESVSETATRKRNVPGLAGKVCQRM
jgi:hypothetical protein